MSNRWFYWSPSTDPCFNLALEEHLFQTLSRGDSLIMLWQNHNTIVVGRYQNTVQEIDGNFVAEQGIRVVRRMTGGGTVYHDLGNLNFTFIADQAVDGQIDFSPFCQPVIDALAALGVEARLSGRNDLTVEGKKFSGNSQYIRGGRVLHHGTLLVNSDLSVLSRALTVKPDKLTSHAVHSISSRVTNLAGYLPAGATAETVGAQLAQQLCRFREHRPYPLSQADLEQIRALQVEKYETWEWNYGRSPRYTIEKSRKVSGCGCIEVSMSIADGGRIEALSISGDFFGSGDPDELAARLIGLPCCRDTLLHALEQACLSQYIRGLTPAEFADILLN